MDCGMSPNNSYMSYTQSPKLPLVHNDGVETWGDLHVRWAVGVCEQIMPNRSNPKIFWRFVDHRRKKKKKKKKNGTVNLQSSKTAGHDSFATVATVLDVFNVNKLLWAPRKGVYDWLAPDQVFKIKRSNLNGLSLNCKTHASINSDTITIQIGLTSVVIYQKLSSCLTVQEQPENMRKIHRR